jgi:hypothetical protein
MGTRFTRAFDVAACEEYFEEVSERERVKHRTRLIERDMRDELRRNPNDKRKGKERAEQRRQP